MATTIQKHIGNLLDVKHGIIVHGCNAQGVMGSGVALAVKNKYPGAFRAYQEAYFDRELRLGGIVPYLADGDPTYPKLIIVNAITQEFYGTDRRHVDYDALRTCFKEVAKLAKTTLLFDIHFPLIGCGLAGGDWSVVAPIIEEELDGMRAHLWVLE